jgi:hypothetical protein
MIDTNELALGSGAPAGAHPNPMYDYLTGFKPRRIKDLFRWVNYLLGNSPAVFAGIMKFAMYVVTKIELKENDKALRETWTDLLNAKLHVKGVSLQTNVDLTLAGNSFISVYKPFTRFLVCDACKGQTNIEKAGEYKFQLKTLKFKYRCAGCGNATVGTIRDVRNADPMRIAIIRWDPRLVDIDYNPISGQSEYYYTIPEDLRHRVTHSNRHTINALPKEFLEALRKGTKFKFAPGALYHMKLPSPAGIDQQWGLPPLTSALGLFFHAAVLRKGNEAIALDYITPFRVLHPAQQTGGGSIDAQINLGRWREEVEHHIKMWRRDPLHIMFSPTPLSVTTMGGQARSLMTAAEIRDCEDSIIAALGYPREFVYGGLSVRGDALALRMLENQLDSRAEMTDDQLKWIISEVADILGIQTTKANYVPFRAIDDTEQKTLMLQLRQLVGNDLSKQALYAPFDINLDEMREQRVQEAVDDARLELKIQTEVAKVQTAAATAAQGGGTMGLRYDVQAIMAKADETAQQLMGMDPGTRKSQLDYMNQSDPVMYSVVKEMLANYDSSAQQQAAQQIEAQGGAQPQAAAGAPAGAPGAPAPQAMQGAPAASPM